MVTAKPFFREVCPSTIKQNFLPRWAHPRSCVHLLVRDFFAFFSFYTLPSAILLPSLMRRPLSQIRRVEHNSFFIFTFLVLGLSLCGDIATRSRVPSKGAEFWPVSHLVFLSLFFEKPLISSLLNPGRICPNPHLFLLYRFE